MYSVLDLQVSALAKAVLAYATHIDDLGQLKDAVSIINHKHISLNIKPEYYKDVGTELLRAIKDILGEAATEEIIDAWKKAYFYLADILIGNETKMRNDIKAKGNLQFNFKACCAGHE